MLEVSISLFLLMISIFILVNITNRLLKMNNERVKVHNELVSLDALGKELKYNISYKELKSKLQSGNWTFKYDDKFIYNIEENQIKNLATTSSFNDRIDVTMVNSNTEDNIMYLKLYLNYNGQHIEKEVKKYKGMSYE